MRLTRSPAQWCASFLLLVAAGTHVPLISDHLEEAPYVGWLFILLSVVCIVLAVAILFVDSPSLWIISGAVCLAAVVAFLASRTIGLPQIGDDVGNWTEPLGLAALFVEGVVVAISAYALASHRSLAASSRTARSTARSSASPARKSSPSMA